MTVFMKILNTNLSYTLLSFSLSVCLYVSRLRFICSKRRETDRGKSTLRNTHIDVLSVSNFKEDKLHRCMDEMICSGFSMRSSGRMLFHKTHI